MRPIHTERLLLRPLEPGDLTDLQALYGSAEIMRWITGRPRSLEETREHLARHVADFDEYGFGLCAALSKETGRLVGRCGAIPSRSELGVEAELAWMFEKAHWGQGLASEVAFALVERGLAEWNAARYWARAFKANVASVRVIEKIGMRFVQEEGAEVFYELPRDR